jgi:hypothetical protein
MGEVARDSASNNTRDGPINDALSTSTDTACNEGVDDEGNMDKGDKVNL